MSDDFDDEFDIDFVNSASNKVKSNWTTNKLDRKKKDLKDVTNLCDNDSGPSNRKRSKDSKNFMESPSLSSSLKAPIPVAGSDDNEDDVDEDDIPDDRKTDQQVDITPPSSPDHTTPEKLGRGARRTKKTEAALKKIQKSSFAKPGFIPELRTNLDVEVDYQRYSNYARADTFELKVRWKTEILRFEVYGFDRISKVLEKVAEQSKVPIKELNVYMEQTSLEPLSVDKTIRDLKLSVVSVLHARMKVVSVDCNEGGGANVGNIELKLQTKDRRNQPVMVKISSSDTMETVIEKYLKETGLERSKVKFFFDGELLNEGDTAQDLDLEGGECIDVHENEK